MMFVEGRGILEPASEVYPELHRTSFLHESFIHGFKIESCVVLIQEIACPKTNHGISDFEIRSPVQCAVERLAYVILFCPVDASGRIIIRLEYYMVEDGARTASDGIFSTDIQGMFGNKGDVFAIIVFFNATVFFFL